MTFLIAAAGTGGHVFPGLAVGEALVDRGITRDDILYLGGDRLESSVYPDEGFPFLQVEVRGLQRSLTPRNLLLPAVMKRARDRVVEAIEECDVRAVLGMGGYVTIPAGLAARHRRVPFFNSEQNAAAGLANRVAARWAVRTFGAFPATEGLPGAVWVGNPVRRPFWDFDRDRLRLRALERYGLDRETPVVGVFGGSLGSGPLNEAVSRMVSTWAGRPIQVLHLAGERFLHHVTTGGAASGVSWVRRGFEDEMEFFYAASHLVIARAGGAVAELTATATPAILVPGKFGSSGHQEGNARFLSLAGAAVRVDEDELDTLGRVVTDLLEEGRLQAMAEAARRIARPGAAHDIADAMIEASR
jgi:UDP-N-acetylglucosamine--N-acetylmuramyl-(pentapeptide) pyrophosphoryl-undecaprenol N-acetylglucosamine transferase